MSNVLDQFIMEDVAKFCPQQFVQYHQCIQKNHEDPMVCGKQQEELSKCIKTSVPSMQMILTKCGSIMRQYESCVRENMESRTINEKCMGLLQQMRGCAENAVDLSSGGALASLEK